MKQDAKNHQKGHKNVRKYAVIVEWTDGEVADADEMPTWAKSAAAARRKARATWTAATIPKFPNCRIDRIFVLTKRMMRDVA